MLALDEPGENDRVFTAEPYTFIIDTDLEQITGEITVDFGSMGFTVFSASPSATACGGGSCSC